MDIAQRLRVTVLKKDQKVTDHMVKKSTYHRWNFAERKTACGRTVREGDARWIINRRGAESSINCVRCLERMQNGNKPTLKKKESKKQAEPVEQAKPVDPVEEELRTWDLAPFIERLEEKEEQQVEGTHSA